MGNQWVKKQENKLEMKKYRAIYQLFEDFNENDLRPLFYEYEYCNYSLNLEKSESMIASY